MGDNFSYNTLNLKRKEKDLDDKFSDLSLSSPATKIRRQDLFAPKVEQSWEDELMYKNDVGDSESPGTMGMIQSDCDCNQDRALVLCSKANTTFYKSLSRFDFPIILNSQLIPELKSLLFPSLGQDILKITEDRTDGQGIIETESVSNDLAVCPWSEFQLPSGSSTSSPTNQMEAKDAEMTEMGDTNTEEENNRQTFEFGGPLIENEGFQHYKQQQQHCMAPSSLNANPIRSLGLGVSLNSLGNQFCEEVFGN